MELFLNVKLDQMEKELTQARKELAEFKKLAQRFLDTLHYEGIYQGEPETVDEFMGRTDEQE